LKHTWLRLVSIVVFLTFLSACLPDQGLVSPPPWQYADLRLLASPGEGIASHQLVGLYTRRFHSQEQIRLDLLDFTAELDYDLYLALDTISGGSSGLPIQTGADLEWDLLLVIPASGPLQAFGPDGAAQQGLSLRVVRDLTLDTIVISLAAARLGGSYRIQVFLTPKNSLEVASSLGPVRSDSWPPPRLPLLLAFWNTFPAYTPAQALRRYDGAHTGPASDRHGLRGLLDAIEATRFPAALLDIKNPVSLSALDFAGALPRLQDLAAQELLILPDQLPLDAQDDNPYLSPSWVRVRAAGSSRQVAGEFGLSPSPFLYSPTFPDELAEGQLQQIGDVRLIFSANNSHEQSVAAAAPVTESQFLPVALPGSLSPQVTRWGAYIWVDLAPAAEALRTSIQASSAGPTLEIRRSLLDAVASPVENQFVILGGDLSQTAWGNPQAAMQTLRYLISRPWIQPVTRAELSTLTAPRAGSPAISPSTMAEFSSQEPVILNNPHGEPLASNLSAGQIHDLLVDELESAPDNTATQLAWQAYEALFAPATVSTPLLAPLRATYLGQVGHLLAAAHWGSAGPGAFCSPVSASKTCLAAIDLDWDGEDEYLLASQNFFALFEARGGYLALAFVRSPAGLHQVSAPSTQFTVGLGDPLSWNPDRGIAGDGSQLRGAFSDLPAGYTSPSWEIYFFEYGPESLTFTSPDGSLRKIFHLTQSGLQVDYVSSQPLTVQIPLAIEPEIRFYPDWGSRYQTHIFPGGWLYRLLGGLQVQILTSETLAVRSFSDSLVYMGQPENPDFDYPPGHFLPFPLALAEISAQGEFSIRMEVNSHP
jgi:hypothetical protein